MILQFPFINQSSDFSCGAACLCGVFHYYGINVHESDIVDGLKSSPEKTSIAANIVRIAEKYGLTADAKQNSSIDDIVQCITEQTPVIINLQAWADDKSVDYTDSYDNGHFCVLIGFEDDKLIFADPLCMYRVYLTREELIRRWHDKKDETYYTKNLAIIITGKEPKFNIFKVKHMG